MKNKNKYYKKIYLLLYLISCVIFADCKKRVFYENIDEIVNKLVWTSDNATLVSTFEVTNAYMAFIKDKKNKRFLIKQKKNWGEKRNVKHAILETINAYIAYTIEVPSQVVWVVPATLEIVGKKDQACAASLHSYIDGEKFSEGFSLRSIFNNYRSKSYPTNILRQTISRLSQNMPLVSMFALDTFIGNPDRIKKNILYVKKEDTCYAIDMGSAFNRNYAELVEQVIKSWLEEKMVFDSKEQKALRTYRKMLHEAVTNFPPDYLIQLCSLLFEKIEASVTEDEALKKAKKMIKQHYASNIILINTLDELIATF